MSKKNTNYFYAVRIRISLAIFFRKKVTNFNTNFKELCKKTKVDVFSEHSVYNTIKTKDTEALGR